jgi:hypothetical protein
MSQWGNGDNGFINFMMDVSIKSRKSKFWNGENL